MNGTAEFSARQLCFTLEHHTCKHLQILKREQPFLRSRRLRLHNIFTQRRSTYTMIQEKQKETFEPMKNVTEEDIKKIAAEALSKNFKVYNRLAEI